MRKNVAWAGLRLGLALALGFSPVLPAAAQNVPTPAFDAFQKAWSAIEDYHETIVVHEIYQNNTQDRTYDYSFKKPSFAHIEVTAGPGRGSGAVWRGGDTVKGHQGGFLSMLRMNVPIADGRATSLRGDTIDVASFAYELEHFLRTPGTLAEGPGPAIEGVPTTAVTLAVADPAKNEGVSKDVLDISNETHLPVRREQYAGETLVKTETFRNVQLNPGLKASDF
jgi:outer membrane lipoprotein-sorting protein